MEKRGILAIVVVIIIGYSMAYEYEDYVENDTTTTNAPQQLDPRPFGPYYCKARCLASCIEENLAATLDECNDFCPAFDENTPCQADDDQCWRTCGIEPSPENPLPDPPSFTPTSSLDDDQEERDPFLIDAAWLPSNNTSLYIIEFYPLNREPRPGEENFFRAMTTSLTYTVRKEDECTEYDARVISVNSNGISAPANMLITAPRPTMVGDEHFKLRNMQRDPQFPDTITVTVDYTMPLGWPREDIAIGGVSFTAVECKGPIVESIEALNNATYPIFVPEQGKSSFEISFPDEVLQSDCLFQLRIASLITRCNTTMEFDQTSLDAPGIDFRINCDTVQGACTNLTDTTEIVNVPPAVAPVPLPDDISVPTEIEIPATLDAPGYVPPGVGAIEVEMPVDEINNITDIDDMPTPPALPIYVVDMVPDPSAQQQAQPIGAGNDFTIIDIIPNGSALPLQVESPATLPPMCELEMFDAEPVPNPMAPALIDVLVMWLERQPIPVLPTPHYFAIRYGPLIRNLVQDDRQKPDIIPGFETILRTGQAGAPIPDPTRQITIPNLQRNALLKVQVCAIYNPDTEPLINWDTVGYRRIDLAALENVFETQMQNTVPSVQSVDPIPQAMPTRTDEDSHTDELVDVPVVIQVHSDPRLSSTMYWVTVLAAVMLVLFTALLVFVCLLRMCNSGRRHKKAHGQKTVYYVNTQSAPPPAINEVVKMPPA